MATPGAASASSSSPHGTHSSTNMQRWYTPHAPAIPYPYTNTNQTNSNDNTVGTTDIEMTDAMLMHHAHNGQSNDSKRALHASSSLSSITTAAATTPLTATKSSSSSSARNMDLWVVSVILALSEAARGVVIPILSNLVNSLGGNPLLLSVCVALFSVGRGISSTVFGWIQYRAQRLHRATTTTTPSSSNNTATAAASLASSNAAVAQSGRWSLILSLIVALIGHIMFLIADSTRTLWLLLVSRVATGFGTGVLSVARTIVAASTTPAERVRYNAWLGIVAYLGYAMTPILGSVNVSFGSGTAAISSYSFGTFLLFIMTIILLICTLIWMIPLRSCRAGGSCCQRYHQMNDDNTEIIPSSSSSHPSSNTYQPPSIQPLSTGTVNDASTTAAPLSTVTVSQVATPSSPAASSTPTPTSSSSRIVVWSDTRIACWLLIACNGITRGTIGVAETFGSQVFTEALGPDDDTTSDVSEFFLALGGIGLVTFMCCDRIVKKIGEWNTLIMSLIILIIGFLFLIDFDTDLPQWRMWIGMILVWSIGSSLVQTVIVSMFSKHVQRLAMGASTGETAMWMGRITAAGSYGRIIIPLAMGGVVGSSDEYSKKSIAFIIVAAIQMLLASSCVWWHQALLLPPLTVHEDSNSDKHDNSDSNDDNDDGSSSSDEDLNVIIAAADAQSHHNDQL